MRVELNRLSQSAELPVLPQLPAAMLGKVARELAALKQAREQCEDATAAYNELVERLQSDQTAGEQVGAHAPK